MAYFDNAATTPPLPEVLDRLNELGRTVFGNSSSTHFRGCQAREVLEYSSSSIAKIFKVPQNNILFTSGGTESNNLALWGALGGIGRAFAWLKSDPKGQIISSVIEHDATKKVIQFFEEMGAPVAWIGVDQCGLIDLNQLEHALDQRTSLVSFHHVQNEIGTLQNLQAIRTLVYKKQPSALLHIDAAQSFLKASIRDQDFDLLSISGHKFGGPKGIGALVLGSRFTNDTTRLGAFLLGASQQFGIRPGTVPVPLVGALVAAIQIGTRDFEKNKKILLDLRSTLISQLPNGAVIHGPRDCSPESTNRAPHILNFSIPGIPSPAMVESLSTRGFCVSAGSACRSSGIQPNRTLVQIGVATSLATSAIRVSFSPINSVEEIKAFSGCIEEIIRELP